MRKLLNTLFVTQQQTYLHRDGDTVVVEKGKQVVLRLPIHNLQSIITFGNVLCSPHLLGLCSERGVCVSMLTEYGRFLARIEGPVSGNVHLRVAQQVSAMDPKRKSDLARRFAIGKIVNARTVLKRRIRDHGNSQLVEMVVGEMRDMVVRLRENELEAATVRGVEGMAATRYFSVFNELLVSQQADFVFTERNRRPPRDPINALLSFLYTLLAHDCRAALECVGLDPQVGYLHELRCGRSSLALDLMEEFRAPLVDRLVVSLVNLQQIRRKDFQEKENGAIVMTDDARKRVLVAWQTKKQEIVAHSFLGEKMPIGMLPYAQALLLARHLRGDLDGYPPYICR